MVRFIPGDKVTYMRESCVFVGYLPSEHFRYTAVLALCEPTHDPDTGPFYEVMYAVEENVHPVGRLPFKDKLKRWVWTCFFE